MSDPCKKRYEGHYGLGVWGPWMLDIPNISSNFYNKYD